MNSLIPKYREAPGLRSGNANGDEDEETYLRGNYTAPIIAAKSWSILKYFGEMKYQLERLALPAAG